LTVSSFQDHVFSFSYVTQARNIAVCVEFRESDEEDAQPLKVNICPKTYRECRIYLIWPEDNIAPCLCMSLLCVVYLWSSRRSSLHQTCLCCCSAPPAKPRVFWWGDEWGTEIHIVHIVAMHDIIIYCKWINYLYCGVQRCEIILTIWGLKLKSNLNQKINRTF